MILRAILTDLRDMFPETASAVANVIDSAAVRVQQRASDVIEVVEEIMDQPRDVEDVVDASSIN